MKKLGENISEFTEQEINPVPNNQINIRQNNINESNLDFE